MTTDVICNGKAEGSVAATLLNAGFDPGVLRPWIGSDGRGYVTRVVNGKPEAMLVNTNATLRKDEWKVLDEAVVQAAKERLRLIADLRAAGLTYNIPNGMGKTVLETEAVSDISAATVSMDPARESESDRVEYALTNLPLPVIHKDFHFSARQIAVSRNTGQPLDVTMGQLAARRVAEEAEKLAIGVGSSITFGGGTVYGLVNHPNAITTVDVTLPTVSGWTPATLVREVLKMRQASENAHHYGPWMLYNAPGWDQYLDDDYSANKGDNTLRQRLEAVNGIQGVRTLDFLTGYKLVLVQMTSDVIRVVMGMDITTIQWETLGGMRLHFKVMAIMVPQIRADFDGNTGIVYANPA